MTFIASVSGSGLVAGALAYIVKRSLDRSLDLMYERLLEKSKAAIQEESRRRAKVFDEQYEALKSVASVVYRLRNVVRELAKGVEKEPASIPYKAMSEVIGAEILIHSLRAMLDDYRAIMPEPGFKIAHSLKHQVQDLVFDFSTARELNLAENESSSAPTSDASSLKSLRAKKADLERKIIQSAKEVKASVDMLHEAFVSHVREFAGIDRS